MHFHSGVGIMIFMSKPPVTLKAARAAKTKALRRLARVPEVGGVGLCRRGGGYALKINLEVEPSVEIPRSINGVEVIVEMVGKIRKLGGRQQPPTYYVVLDNEGWAVRRLGASRHSSIHDTQREAIVVARELARSASGALVIHSREGSVRKRASYAKSS